MILLIMVYFFGFIAFGVAAKLFLVGAVANLADDMLWAIFGFILAFASMFGWVACFVYGVREVLRVVST